MSVSGRGRAENARYILITDREAGREQVNKIREEIMDETLLELKKMHLAEFKKKINKFQKEAKMERDIERAHKKREKKKQIAKVGKKYTLRCFKCDQFACESSDIRIINDQHHVVISRDFKKRRLVIGRPAKTYGRENDYETRGVLQCSICRQEWGVQACYKSQIYDVIKLVSFFLQDDRDQRLQFKKWKTCPFDVPEFDFDDIYDVNSDEDRSDEESLFA